MDPVLAPVQTRQFGKYTLVAKLATGGMAEIFLARLQGAAGFEKLVCVKVILPALAKDQQFVQMFLAEAKIAAQISHPNVCSVFELGEIAGRYYIAMEYLAGVPLACFRRPDLYVEPPDPRLLAALGVQACEGLHHAHQLKRPDGTLLEVVHRDISGNNLFATVDGVVKVLDFGVAKVHHTPDAPLQTSSGSVKGTFAYMAPEQLRGERLDRRTDVFAMGIVLWELACRRHLFKRDTEYLTFQAITGEPIPDARDLRPDLPAAFAAVISKSLARDRRERYPTARALAEALTKAVAPLGGALAGSALGEEIERAFASRLRGQRALIKSAREGEAFDLEIDLGPGVGHGGDLLLTPAALDGEGLQPVEPPSETMAVMPLPLHRRASRLPWVIAALAIAVAAVAIVMLSRKSSTAAGVPADAAAPIAKAAIADAAVIATAPIATPDAAVAAVVAVAPTNADAAVIATAPVDDAGVEPDAVAPVAQITPGLHRPHPRRPATSIHDGPPGFITIDSAPVYAVITIDGKRYGETPLVQVSLAPGRHAVRAVSATGAVRNASITIESDKVAPARRFEW